MKRLLNAKGIPVEYFASAHAFLDAVPAGRKNGIAVVDISMPECDGFALTDKMQALNYRLPILSSGKEELERSFGFLPDEKNAGPMVIADKSDNPGGGAPGDTTHILRKLIKNSILNLLSDGEAKGCEPLCNGTHLTT